MPSSTSSSEAAGPGAPDRVRLARVLAWAIGLVAIANLAVGLRADALLADVSVGELAELDRRLEAFPAAGEVKVLVFGNSHALFALRPPALAPALGLAADEAFNLALPGATAFEVGLLVDRYAPRFPAARRAVVCVDELLLTLLPWFNDARIRYQTRFRPVPRVRYAGYQPDLERWTGTVAWLPFPLADFAPVLRGGLRDDPRRFALRLLRGDPAPSPGNNNARAARLPYRWGYPPVSEAPTTSRAWRVRYARAHTPAMLAKRASGFFGAPEARARSLEDLEAACRALEARGLAVELVAPPYSPAMTAHLVRAQAAELAAHRAALAAHLAATGRRLHAPAVDLPPTAFIDADHLTAEGARRFAAALARSWND